MQPLTRNRIDSIDFLKGLVMVIMALDHTRDYFFQPINIIAITDPAQASVPVYLTRWISHFCAPAFSFLAGISAFLVGRKKTRAELSTFLLTRGIWLVFLEVTIITFAWYLDVRFRNIDLAVIWCLGMSMIVLAAVIHLPKNAILIFALVVIVAHNLLDNIHFEGSILWGMFHELTSVRLTDALTLNIVYPIVPWIGVMALGYYFGNFYVIPVTPEQRRKLFNIIGASAILLFIILRWSSVYGEPREWRHYENMSQTIMSFMNLTKYPPSLLYLCATLGITFFLLANSEKWKGAVINFFSVFGRVPFFYYLLHLYLIRVLGLIAAEATGYGWRIMIQESFDVDLHGFGFSLPVVYLIWMGIILLLYPLCKKFDDYKTRNKGKWWLSYL